MATSASSSSSSPAANPEEDWLLCDTSRFARRLIPCGCTWDAGGYIEGEKRVFLVGMRRGFSLYANKDQLDVSIERAALMRGGENFGGSCYSGDGGNPGKDTEER